LSRSTARPKLSKVETRVLALLVLSVAVNYIDRGALSVAAPQLTKELSLGPQMMGVLLSGFFWTYALSLILAGWLVDRYSVLWVFGIGYAMWSAATFATGLVTGFTALMVMRLLLGLGESVAYPAYSKIIAGSFPQTHRGIANSLVDMGSKIGPAVGTLIGGLVVGARGWRTLFLALGVASLLWLIPWVIWGPRETATERTQRVEPPPMLEILSKRDAWGTFFGLFGLNYIWYFLLTWLPSYLVNVRHFSTDQMAIVSAIPLLGTGLSALFCGWLSDRWIARGGSPTKVRKFFASTGLMVTPLIIPAALVEDPLISVCFLLASSIALGVSSSNLWAVTQTLAGRSASGKWTGLQNSFGNLAGVVGPSLTGFIVAWTGSYVLAFVVAGLTAAMGGLSFRFVVGKLEPIEWKERPKLVSEAAG